LNGILFLLLSLPIALPVAVVTALAIKIDSRGPLIFTQERVGEGGNIFRMHKFRSMHVDAELGGARFAQSEDERVTRVGRFIRRYRLDELPQFANILTGQMSLIGPRPEQVGFVKQFEKEIPFYGYRHLVKPGITGWAQVNHGYAADEKETRTKLEHDLYYVKHFSIWIDVLIGLKTFRTIITGFGAR
jgi:lipopolysaccharide/colanic/teichoic acid biosynthesis glycosyltransferase